MHATAVFASAEEGRGRVAFRTIIDLPCMVTAVSGRFGVHVFEGRCTVEDMEIMEQRGDVWMRSHPGPLVELVVIYPSDSGMTSAERSRMQAIIKRWEPLRRASATVILAEGIVASLQRSILTGLLMVVRPPHPSRVFGKTPDAVDYLAPFVRELNGPSVTPDILRSEVADLCDRFIAGRRARGLTVQLPG